MLKKYSSNTTNFIRNYSNSENKSAETRLYFLVIGLFSPLMEFFLEIFKVRLHSEWWFHLGIGTVFLFSYFLSKKNKFSQKNGKQVLSAVFLAFAFFTLYKIIFFPFELITFCEFLVVVFFSYTVFRNINYFLIFNSGCFLFFCFLSGFHMLEFKLTIVYLNATIALSIFSYLRHLVVRSSREKLLFSNSIVHNGNSLIIAKNKVGEVSFCSNNIQQILGYTPAEVIGKGFDALTDKESVNNTKVENEHALDKLYVEKLKCKNGDYKYIQWQDKEHATNLFVSIGQDVTEKIKIQNDYQALIQSANDIIYKTDANGNFVFINDYGERVLGYKLEELTGKHFTSIVRQDFVKKMEHFYITNVKEIDSYTTQEFPIVIKNGSSIWVSQNVTVEKDEYKNVISFSAIVRDITPIRNAELLKIKKQNKIQKNNAIIKLLTLKPYNDSDSFSDILENIIKKAALGLNVDRVSVWNHFNRKIECRKSFSVSEDMFSDGEILLESQSPTYFKALADGSTIIANNICENEITKELCLLPDNDIKSLLDVPIFLNGVLSGLLCCETTTAFKAWDTEDVNFARSIADIISISTEAQKRRKLEKQLLFRGEMLAATAKITEQLLVSNNVEKTLTDFLYLIGESTRVDHVYFYDYNLTNNSLTLKSEWCSPLFLTSSIPQKRNQFSIDELGIISNHLLNNTFFSALTNTLRPSVFKNILEECTVLSILMLPVFIKNKFYGFIGFDDCKLNRIWSEDQLMIVQSLTTNVSNAIERISNEKIIQESENNFRQINETIQDVFWLFDVQKRKYLYISPNVKQIFGIPDTEFYANTHNSKNFVFEEDMHKYSSAESLLKTQDSYEIEYRIKIEGGGYKWINEKSFAIKNELGELIRNSGICEDVTEKKKAESEIKQLSVVAEKTTNGILIADKEGRAVWANQGYLNMFEVPANILYGKFPRDLFNADDEYRKKIPALNGNNFSIEIQVQTYLKKPIWIELNNTPIVNDEGEVIQQIEILTDVTEKIKAKKAIEQHSRDLEFQNTLKEKLINASSLEEITKETLGFVRASIQGCNHISMFSLDEKKQNLFGYQLQNDRIITDNYTNKELNSFETIKDGSIFIEKDLINNPKKSISDLELIELDVKSYIVLPIISENEVIGSLNVCFDSLFSLKDNEIKNLENFSSLLAVALKQLNLKTALQLKDKDNISSLTYAKNIQNTILPNLKLFGQCLTNVSLLFKPKDIVSGDFYWAVENEDYTFVSVADCTGHGVPGAFLTLIGSRILEQIVVVEKVTSPAEILTKLDFQLFNSLNIKQEGIIRDGMEISICAINKKTKKLVFAGAGLSLIYFNDNEEFFIKGQRKSIGDFRQSDFSFENHEITVSGKETFFMSTDGYQDQLGGTNYKRMSKKKTVTILKMIKDFEPQLQEEILATELDKYIGHHSQTDDITILGFKINIT